MNMSDDEEDYMEFTPIPGFDIRQMAKKFSDKMAETHMPLVIHLPNGVDVEFEPGCTRKEIIDGYNLGMKHKMKVKHQTANSNIKKEK